MTDIAICINYYRLFSPGLYCCIQAMVRLDDGTRFCPGVVVQVALDRSHETAELTSKVFELSQTLRQQWLTADYATKCRLLEIVFLNCRLDGANLVPTMRKPFDVLAEGLVSKNSRGDWI